LHTAGASALGWSGHGRVKQRTLANHSTTTAL
jgi:hypothetical protein